MPKSLYIDPVKVREPGYIHFEDIPVCQYNKTIKQDWPKTIGTAHVKCSMVFRPRLSASSPTVNYSAH